MLSKVGAYEVIHELKSGGMGAVLLGRRRGPGTFEQLVAIKTIRAELASAANVRAMFLDEAAILARLNHPGVATVHDFGEEDGNLYMVMEYVAGIPFRDVAELQPPPGVLARAVAEACRGLHAAHELRDLSGNLLGLVHRDISPDNLLLGFDGHVKVIDFGIALVKNRQAPVTEFGTVKGKPPYMSPEQVKNEAMDRRSDVFSLAVVLHEMLAGRALFDGDSIYAIARAVEHQVIKPPSEILGRPLPAGLDTAVMNALERDLARRTPTAAEFAEQLEQVISASGHETLESWAERELAAARDDHRAWLAKLLSGRDGTTLLGVGRLGKTEISPIASADTVMSRPAGTVATDSRATTPRAAERPAGTTSLSTDVPDEPAPRRRALLLFAALFALGLVSTLVIVLMTRQQPPSARPLSTDSAIDAAIAMLLDDSTTATNVDGARLDGLDGDRLDASATALVDATIASGIDATTAVDAPARRTSPDAGMVRPRDAAITSPPPDAPTSQPQSVGTGMLTVKHKGDAFVNVVLDGRVIGASPMFKKKIPAGRHTIELLDAKTGESVHKETFVVEDGKEVTIRP